MSSAWLAAAADFQLNPDFDVDISSGALRDQTLQSVVATLCNGSKQTCQLFHNKSIMYRIVHNLGIAQMPLLLELQEGDAVRPAVECFVDVLRVCSSSDSSASEVIVKPTHLHCGRGSISIDIQGSRHRDVMVDTITTHIENFMVP